MEHNGRQLIGIEGQLLRSPVPSHDPETAQDLEELELPVLAQREIESYLKRVDIWLAAKYGPEDGKQKIKSKEIQDILIQAAIDPQLIPGYVRPLQGKWEELYW